MMALAKAEVEDFYMHCLKHWIALGPAHLIQQLMLVPQLIHRIAVKPRHLTIHQTSKDGLTPAWLAMAMLGDRSTG